MNWKVFAQTFLGLAEEIVPIFIHNPKSQQIEGIVLTGVSALSNLIPTLASPTSPPPPSPSTTTFATFSSTPTT